MTVRTHTWPLWIGTTTERTATILPSEARGAPWWDTTLSRMFFWSGTVWVSAGGGYPFSTTTVDPGGNADFTDLATAISTVSAGTTLLVGPGDYDQSSTELLIDKQLVIVGLADVASSAFVNIFGTSESTIRVTAGGCYLANLYVDNVKNASGNAYGLNANGVSGGLTLKNVTARVATSGSVTNAVGLYANNNSVVLTIDCTLIGQLGTSMSRGVHLEGITTAMIIEGGLTTGTTIGVDNDAVLPVRFRNLPRISAATPVTGNSDGWYLDNDSSQLIGTAESYLEFDGRPTAPTTPAAGKGRIWWNDSTKTFYQRDDAGLDTDLAGGGADSGEYDLDGEALIIDTDADSFLIEITDDVVAMYLAAVARFKMTVSGIQGVSSSVPDLGANVAGERWGNIWLETVKAIYTDAGGQAFIQGQGTDLIRVVTANTDRIKIGSTGLTIEGTNDIIFTASATNVRRKLTAPKTFYVATTGSDSNDGSIGSPWLTINHAIQTVCRTYDFSIFNITIQINNGTYSVAGNVLTTTPFVTGGGSLVINGNLGSPSSVILNASIPAQTTVFNHGGGCLVYLQGLTIQSAQAGSLGMYLLGASKVNAHTIRFGQLGTSVANGHHMLLAEKAVLNWTGPYEVFGGAARHIDCSEAGTNWTNISQAITITGSPAIGVWYLLHGNSLAQRYGAGYTGAPAAGCQQYNVTQAAHLRFSPFTPPGTVAGVTGTGGTTG